MQGLHLLSFPTQSKTDFSIEPLTHTGTLTSENDRCWTVLLLATGSQLHSVAPSNALENAQHCEVNSQVKQRCAPSSHKPQAASNSYYV